jgi:diguanylate cyclase
MLAGLADLTRTMIERTRVMEEGMRRSEEEADTLRSSLARAQREAQVDHLTGLPNRRAFEGVLEREYREAQAGIDPLCVAFCDIDHFKRVNDTRPRNRRPRDPGDRTGAAAHFQRKVPWLATAARKFVMLFRGMSMREAHKLLDDARAQLGARRFVNRKTDEPIGGITFRAGWPMCLPT